MDGVDVLCLILTAAEGRAQPARNDRAADIEVDLSFLVRRLVAREWVSRVERFILEQELPISMKRADAPTIDDLRCRLPLSALAKTIGPVFCREGIVVDPNILGLRPLVLPGRAGRRAPIHAGLRRPACRCFV